MWMDVLMCSQFRQRLCAIVVDEAHAVTFRILRQWLTATASKGIRQAMEKNTVYESSGGNVPDMICTNAASMGVNFHGVNHIVNFGPQHLMDTFVQQIGRGGRS
ncbi:RH52A-like protein, partial [Mya arenaria]